MIMKCDYCNSYEYIENGINNNNFFFCSNTCFLDFGLSNNFLTKYKYNISYEDIFELPDMDTREPKRQKTK